jgi:gluconolactonase
MTADTGKLGSMPLSLLALLAMSQEEAPPVLVAPGATLQVLGEGYKFTEGPAVDKQGNVYFTDLPNDRIMKWSIDGHIGEWLKPAGRSNGMFFDSKENLIACADGKNELWSIAPDKSVTVLVEDAPGNSLNGPNDVWVLKDGGIYFTDPLYSRDYWARDAKTQRQTEGVYFLSPDHKQVTCVDADLTKSNGLIGNDRTLYVADIGAGKTFSYRIEKDGSLTGKKLFCEMGSDGMTIDRTGNVYLTGHGVTAFDPKGRKIWHVNVPENWTANVTFGGPDRRLLFITASERVYGLKMAVQGY